MPAYDATFNGQAAVDPIDIAPFKGQAFADSQTKTAADQRYRLKRLREMPNELAELFVVRLRGCFMRLLAPLTVTSSTGLRCVGMDPFHIAKSHSILIRPRT